MRPAPSAYSALVATLTSLPTATRVPSSPLNVAAVQAIAKWLHPDLFADLDPEATLRTLYERFQAVPLSGVYWTGLE